MAQASRENRPPRMVERATVDTVVIDGPHAGNQPDKYWSQASILKEIKKQKEAGQRWVLGRLVRVPYGDTKKNGVATTTEQVEHLLKTLPSTEAKALQWCWVISEHTQQEAQTAAAFIASL